MGTPARRSNTLGAVAAELRRTLPIGTYLKLLHNGVLGGVMPKVNPVTGQPTGEFDELSTKDRIDLAKFLIDKAMPDPPKEVVTHQVEAEDAVKDPESLRLASEDELRRLIETVDTTAEVLANRAAEPEPDL